MGYRSFFCLVFSGVALVLGAVMTPAHAAQEDDYMKRNKEKKEEAEKKGPEEVKDCMPANLDAMSPELQAAYKQLEKEGNRGAVLGLWRIYEMNMAKGDFAEATRVMDLMLARIGYSSAGDESAKKARSKFKGEDEKNFRGEPYEQAMIYFHRGLLYMRAADYENARAMFRSGALVDRSSEDAKEDEKYNDDLAEMDYGEALCNRMLGLNDRIEESLKVARGHARNATSAMEVPETCNSVLVFASGMGPQKYATGDYAQFLRFIPGNGASSALDVTVDGTQVASLGGPLDNMSFQATTRGDREVDAILAGKAQFKKGASVVGDLAIVSGAMVGGLGNSDSAPGVGAGLAIIGLIAKGVSAAANPAADVRMLYVADDIYMVPLSLTPGEHTVQFKCPTTGTSFERKLVRGNEPFGVVMAFHPTFGAEINAAIYADLAKNEEALMNSCAEQWTGSWKSGKQEDTLVLGIAKRDGENFSGYMKVTGNLTPSGIFPCSGKIDEKAMRAEFNCVSDKSIYILMTGKSAKKGSKSSGIAYMVSAAGMNALGKYKIETASPKKGETGKKEANGEK